MHSLHMTKSVTVLILYIHNKVNISWARVQKMYPKNKKKCFSKIELLCLGIGQIYNIPLE